MFKNHKKRNKKIKSGKNAGAIKNNEISEFTIDFTLEDQPVFTMELPLKHKDDSNNSNWENSFVYYQFKSLRTFYVHDDLEFLKAVFMTKHPEIFKNYEKYLYRFSQDIQETISHKDYQELKMHKEQDLKKSKELLKEDCDSYFLFYAENDGILPNTDFILLQDALQVPKVRNNLDTFENKTKNKFIRRYEITKDRLVVFLFYFFQEYHLRNINVAFLREFVKFFFKFKNSKKILNSSKIFICVIFNYSFKIAKVLEESALDFAVLVYGDKIGSNSQFTVLINELGNFILENKIKEMNLNWFLKFINGLKVISNAEKNDIYSMAKEKKHIIEELKLEGRNENEYFE